MSDGSSVYKICPHCGQSVSEAAKFCPSCGSRFAEEAAEFVAYERYPDPPQGTAPKLEDTVSFAPVEPQGDQSKSGGAAQPAAPAQTEPGAPLYPGPDRSANSNLGQPRSVDTAGGETILEAFRKTAEAGGVTMADAARRSDNGGGNSDGPPPMGGKLTPDDGNRKKGLVVTVIAAVLLIAVIAVGVVMAFRLGIVGSKEDPKDSMTLAQEAYEQKDYKQAIAQLEQMIKDNTATAESYTLLAQAYEGSGDMEAAAKAYLDGAEALDDGTLLKHAQDSYLRLAKEAQTAQENDKAREYYNLVLEQIDPNNTTAIAGLSEIGKETMAAASPSPSPSPVASPKVQTSPQASPQTSPQVSSNIAPPSPTVSAGGNSNFVEKNEVVVTPTPTPAATPTPTVKPSPSPTVKPSATTKPTATPKPSPSPTPTPPPSVSLNGHEYVQYTDARGWAEITYHISESGGHLLTINSEDEYNKAVELANKCSAVFVWLGATRNDDGSWSWVTGETLSTDDPHWLEGEPSGGADEARLAMVWIKGRGWYYVDVPDTVTEYSGKRAYIIEYGG